MLYPNFLPATSVPRAASLAYFLSLCADCKRFPPAGMHSRLRACVVRYLGLRVVVEGKQEPGTTYVYLGVGLTGAEQLLLASVRKRLRFPTRICLNPKTWLSLSRNARKLKVNRRIARHQRCEVLPHPNHRFLPSLIVSPTPTPVLVLFLSHCCPPTPTRPLPERLHRVLCLAPYGRRPQRGFCRPSQTRPCASSSAPPPGGKPTRRRRSGWP